MMRSLWTSAFIFGIVMPVCTCQWVSIGLNLRRSLGSMHTAVESLGGAFISPKTAFTWVEPHDHFDLYKVSFNAIFRDGIRRLCYAKVLWTFEPFIRTPFDTGCTPPWPLN